MLIESFYPHLDFPRRPNTRNEFSTMPSVILANIFKLNCIISITLSFSEWAVVGLPFQCINVILPINWYISQNKNKKAIFMRTLREYSWLWNLSSYIFLFNQQWIKKKKFQKRNSRSCQKQKLQFATATIIYIAFTFYYIE